MQCWPVGGVSLRCKKRFTHSNGLVWIKANEAWGSLLTNGEPRRSQCALSGGLHPNLQDQGNFSHQDEKQMSLFFCLALVLSHRLRFRVLPLVEANLALRPPLGGWGRNMSTMGRVAAFRYRAVSTWSRSKISQLSHGKTQTRRFDKNVMLWRFPLKMDKRWLAGFSRWTQALKFYSHCWSSLWPLTTGRKRTHGDQTASHHVSRVGTFTINPLWLCFMHLQLPRALLWLP